MPIGTSFAVTIELLPERIDVFSAVLQGAGLGAIVAIMLAALMSLDSDAAARIGTIAGTCIGFLLFALGLVIQWLS